MLEVDLERYERVIRRWFQTQSPGRPEAIWCLGNVYRSCSQNHSHHDEHCESDLHRFLQDAESRILLSYRRGFPPIDRSPEEASSLMVRIRNATNPEVFTSDTGWGCMIRSGQSLLANALARYRLGRTWRSGRRNEHEQALLNLFADDPLAPFSIHGFVAHGASACDTRPGEWFGPSATAKCIRGLMQDLPQPELQIYVNCQGADVDENRLFAFDGDETKLKPTLILLGVRLGTDRITPVYWATVAKMLELQQSVGIAGGQPASSYYFYAHQGDEYFYLDPHTTRQAASYVKNDDGLDAIPLHDYHCKTLNKIHVQNMDPSMLIGFLINDYEDWLAWKHSVRSDTGQKLIHIIDAFSAAGNAKSAQPSDIDDIVSLDEDS